MQEEEYKKVLDDIKKILVRLGEIDRQQESFSKRLFGKELNNVIKIIEVLNGLVRGNRDEGTPGLKSIIHGSKELGVKPIRTEITELNDKMDRILLIEGRVRWLLGIFGVTGLAGVISLIILLRQLLEI